MAEKKNKINKDSDQSVTEGKQESIMIFLKNRFKDIGKKVIKVFRLQRVKL